MSAKYTIRPDSWLVRYPEGITRVDRYHVVNPAGVDIAHGCSWRVARKIADLYNADVERRSTKVRRFTWVPNAVSTTSSSSKWVAVSLQEEA